MDDRAISGKPPTANLKFFPRVNGKPAKTTVSPATLPATTSPSDGLDRQPRAVAPTPSTSNPTPNPSARIAEAIARQNTKNQISASHRPEVTAASPAQPAKTTRPNKRARDDTAPSRSARAPLSTLNPNLPPRKKQGFDSNIPQDNAPDTQAPVCISSTPAARPAPNLPNTTPRPSRSSPNSSTPTAKHRTYASNTALISDSPAQADQRALPPIPETDSDLSSVQDKFLALARLSGRRKPFAKQYHALFRQIATKAADKFIKNPSEETLLEFLSLPKRVLIPALRNKFGRAKQRLKKYLDEGLDDKWDTPASHEATKEADRADEATKLAEMGQLGLGCRVLTDDTTVADIDEAVIHAMKLKHPQGAPLPFGTNLGPDAGRGPSKDDILKALASFKQDTSPGISGWTVPMLRIAIEAPRVLEFITNLVSSVVAGTAVGRDMLCTCRLTPLRKPDGGLRPVAVGEMLYRLAMKVLLGAKMEEKALLPNQLGVKTPGGVEPIVISANKAINGKLPQNFTHLTTLDAKNAFNNQSRRTGAQAIREHAPKMFRAAKWAYQTPTDLVLGDVVIQSKEGWRQGDPLGTFCFSVGIRPALERLAERLGPNRVIVAYLDDIYIFSTDDGALSEAIDFFKDWPSTLVLNQAKCKTISFEEMRETGFHMLGTVVGAKNARRLFLREKVKEETEKMDRLRRLNHQTALLFLRKCISADLRHLQRTLRTDDIMEEWDTLDDRIWGEVRRIRARDELETEDAFHDDMIGREAMSLPVRLGGLGLLSHRDCSTHAYAAAQESAEHLVNRIFGVSDAPAEPETLRSQSQRCNEMFEEKQKVLAKTAGPLRASILVENCTVVSRKWLETIPYYPLLRLSDNAVSVGLRYRTLAKPAQTICRCGKTVDIQHEEACIHNNFTSRHNNVRDEIAKALRHGVSTDVICEPGTTDGRRRNDIGLRGPGKHGRRDIDYDVKVYSFSNQYGSRSIHRPIGQDEPDHLKVIRERSDKWLESVADKATKNKPESRIDFKPLAFSSGGMMSKDTLKELKMWVKEIGEGEISRMLERISICLLESRAALFAGSLLLGSGAE